MPECRSNANMVAVAVPPGRLQSFQRACPPVVALCRKSPIRWSTSSEWPPLV